MTILLFFCDLLLLRLREYTEELIKFFYRMKSLVNIFLQLAGITLQLASKLVSDRSTAPTLEARHASPTIYHLFSWLP